jgi:hypothetical protein
MSQSLILITALFSTYWEEKKEERKKEKWLGGFFSQGQTCLAGYAVWDFCSC